MVQTYLIYAMFVVGLGLGAYYWAGRKNAESSMRLRLSFGPKKGLNSRSSSANAESLSTQKSFLSSDIVAEPTDLDLMLRSKNLNVMFVYNGHNWDSYEVLGIPAGSNLSSIQKAYKESLARTNSQSHDFINAAYQAILQDLSKQSRSSTRTG